MQAAGRLTRSGTAPAGELRGEHRELPGPPTTPASVSPRLRKSCSATDSTVARCHTARPAASGDNSRPPTQAGADPAAVTTESSLSPTGSSNYGFGPIAVPSDETTARPGARCGSGRETLSLGVKGILVQAAELGYITQVTCRMPECSCLEELGARYVEPVTAEHTDWSPTHEHFPRAKVGDVSR